MRKSQFALALTKARQTPNLNKQRRNKQVTNMKVVITIIGRDCVGIVAMVSNVLATHNVNIEDINQNIVNTVFNMVMIADMSASKIPLKELQQILREKGAAMGLEIKVQHEDIFKTMHRI